MLTYQQEFLYQVKEDLEVLAKEEYDEVIEDDITFNIDWDTAFELEELGVLSIYTARDEGKLVGHFVVTTYKSLLSKGTLVANGQALFVTKKHRRSNVAYDMIQFAGKCLMEDGAKVLYISTTKGTKVEPLMDKLGMDISEIIYRKGL